MADPNILRGAQLKAAARTLGLSEDELFKVVSRGKRQKERRLGREVSSNEILDDITNSAERVAAVNREMPAEDGRTQLLPNSEVEFGPQGNQDEFQNFGGVDRDGRVVSADKFFEEKSLVAGGRDDNLYYDPETGEAVILRDGQVTPDREAGDARDQLLNKSYGLDRQVFREARPGILDDEGEAFRYVAGGIAPKSTLADAAAQLDNAIAAGVPGAFEAKQRLIANLRTDTGREQLAARRLIAADATPKTDSQLQAIADERARRIVDQPRVTSGHMGARVVRAPMTPFVSQPGDIGAPTREQVAAEILKDLSPGGINPDAMAANYQKAAIEASGIAERDFQIGGQGTIADQTIADMGTITKLGALKDKKDSSVNVQKFPVIPAIQPGDYENVAAQYRDQITPSQGPLPRGQAFIASNTPGYRTGGAFKDLPQVAIGQQLSDVGAALGNIRMGPEKLQIDAGLTQIRGINDLENAVDAVIALGNQTGESFYKVVDGKNVFSETPGIEEVLNKARMNPNAQINLAGALYQLEAGRNVDINQPRKELFELGIDSEPNVSVTGGAQTKALGGGAVEPARAGRQKTGSGREVTAALQGLTGDPRANPPLSVSELAQARMPYIGAAAGETPKRAQFLSAEAAQMTPEQRVQRYGEEKGGIANEVERRAKADDERRALPPSNSPEAEARRRSDAAGREIGLRNQDRDLAAGYASTQSPPASMIEDVNRLRSQNPGFLTNQRAPEQVIGRATGQGVDNNISFIPASMLDYNKQTGEAPFIPGAQNPAASQIAQRRATSSAVNAPLDPLPQQVRGGWMGGDNSGRVETVYGGGGGAPQGPRERGGDLAIRQAAAIRRSPGGGLQNQDIERVNVSVMEPTAMAGKLLPSGGPRRIDDSIRNELAALNSRGRPQQGPRTAPQQGPAMSSTPVDRTPDQRVSNMDKLKGKARRAINDFRGAGPRQRAAAYIGAGVLGAMGIDGLIGNERDRRDQEGYQ